MPYIKRTVHAGNMIEIKKYYSARYGKKNNGIRAERQEVSSEKQKEINERNAVEKLTWLLNANFGAGDYHVTLTYAESSKPEPEQAKENMRKFLRKLRAAYREHGSELKYVEVTEYENKRIHHHIVLPYIDSRILSSLWKHGGVHFRAIYSDELSKLAEYLVKETGKTFRGSVVSAKRWNSSRNLKKPEIKKEIVPADSWRRVPSPVSGYYIPADKIIVDVDAFGYPYQKYTMIKVSEKGRKKAKRQEQSLT